MPPRRPKPSPDQPPLDSFPEALVRRHKECYSVDSMLACTNEEFMQRRQEQLEMSNALSLDKLNQQDFVSHGFLNGNYEIWQRQAECGEGKEDSAIALVGLAWAVHDAIAKSLPPTSDIRRRRDGVFDIAKRIDGTVHAQNYAYLMRDDAVIEQQHRVINIFGYECRASSTPAFMEGVLSFTPERLVGNFLRAYRNAQQQAIIIGPHNADAQKHVWRRPSPSASLEILA